MCTSQTSIFVPDQLTWDSDITLALIKEYKTLRETNSSNKQTSTGIWKKISTKMHEKGYTVSASECRQKWTNLEMSFKTRTEQGTGAEWYYFHLLKDIFKNQTNKRLSTQELSQIKRRKKSSKNYSQLEILEGEDIHPSNFLPSSESDDDDSTRETEEKTIVKSTEETPPKWFETFIAHYKKVEEEKRETKERMHKDMLAIESRKCVLLEKLISTISKPAVSPKIVNTVSVSQEMFERNFK